MTNFKAKSLIFLFLASFSIAGIHKTSIPLNQIFSVAERQYKNMLAVSKDHNKYPRTTSPDGRLHYVSIKDWTGGFWPGSLWYVYEYTRDDFWKQQALAWTKSLESNQFNDKHHDIGFMMYCSYGNAFRLTQDTSLIPILLQSAKTLLKRYSPTVGAIKSWDERISQNGQHIWKYPVIIDNMMNLELLFFASEYTGDPVYRDIAVKHAETTMQNHLRPDYSCFHLINYDEQTGKVLDKKTVQGFSDNSVWARGQAWGVYGYTVVYRYTKDKRFLEVAQKMADYYLGHDRLPDDKIPYWDFYAGQPGYSPEWNFDPDRYTPIPRDASAAAVMASALLELSEYSDKTLQSKYLSAAETMLLSLSSEEYLAQPGSNNNFILKNSVGHLPKNSEVNVPIIYADYYFLEALVRYNHQVTNKK